MNIVNYALIIFRGLRFKIKSAHTELRRLDKKERISY